MKVRKGDQVVVISGNDKGARGEVIQVIREKERVVVEGANMRWKHKRGTQQSPQGERVQEACSMHVSNVMRIDPQTNEPTRRKAKPDAAGKQ